MKSITLLKWSPLLSSGHGGKSLTVTVTEWFSVSTPRVSPLRWASGNTAITIIFGVNTIQIYVATLLQEKRRESASPRQATAEPVVCLAAGSPAPSRLIRLPTDRRSRVWSQPHTSYCSRQRHKIHRKQVHFKAPNQNLTFWRALTLAM